MATTFVSEGKTIQYTNAGSAISSGAVVVIGNLVGVAVADIAASTGVGSVAVSGVFTLTKNTGEAFTQGQKIHWDTSNLELTGTPNANTKPAGIAWLAAGSSATTAQCLLGGADDTAQAAGVAALTENSTTIGGTNDGNMPLLTATALALDLAASGTADAQQDIEAVTVADGTITGTANGTLELVGATNSGDVSGAIMNNFKDVQAALAVADINFGTMGLEVNHLVADVADNTAAIREVATSVNAILTALKNAGLMVTS